MFRELEIDSDHIRKVVNEALENLEDYKYLYKVCDSVSKELRIRIDKATSYINSFNSYIPEDNKEELLKILKGD